MGCTVSQDTVIAGIRQGLTMYYRGANQALFFAVPGDDTSSTKATMTGETISEKVNIPANPTERFRPKKPTMAHTGT